MEIWNRSFRHHLCRRRRYGNKFDNYEGMTCLKDIEKFNVDLEQIYSVKLSDELSLIHI